MDALIEQDSLQTVNLGSHFQITPAGLVVIGRPSFDAFDALGETLRTLDRALQFAVGDFFHEVDTRFPDKASQILDHTGWSESTLKVYSNTAKHVPPENRRMDALTYSHHQAVVGLPPKDQKKWLDEAAEGDDGKPWSVSRLKNAIKAGNDQAATAWFIIVRCESEQTRDNLMKELESRGHRCSVSERRGDK